MRISFQVAFIILIGLGAIYAGVSNMVSPSTVFSMFYDIDLSEFNDTARFAIESQTRLLAGMWISAGLFSFVVIKNFESNTNAIRLILLGLSLGAIGELSTAIILGANLQPAIMKASFQIGIYITIELWRVYVCKKITNSNE